ncbi:hypothetical protein SEA_BIPPER_77 [Mycobacterium phage Bipper]|uniref:Uncharacterized protein n=1 Tax=Mycobacterium phage Bipper TaxID=1805457 RepID=A0A142F2K5_9CAUD|nr:hypothetical protein KCH39_gp100 [Mycobacterium phage Bipper]AMQ67012.1 hypothetical protein SEA_BIPPER_77 [Mycobacterium phage Bipper]
MSSNKGQLTQDQRWLLMTVGTGITRALLNDPGLDAFMSSMRGYLGSARDGAPEWLDSFEVRGGKIVAPSRGEIRVTVTRSQIKAFRATIAPELLDELNQIESAQMAEHWCTELWCRCSSGQPHKDFRGRDAYHCTDDEEAHHMQIVWDLRDREKDCLERILVRVEPVGQLGLFDESEVMV